MSNDRLNVKFSVSSYGDDKRAYLNDGMKSEVAVLFKKLISKKGVSKDEFSKMLDSLNVVYESM